MQCYNQQIPTSKAACSLYFSLDLALILPVFSLHSYDADHTDLNKL